MDDGFYTVTYVGVAGMGLCVLLFENGTLRGFDMRGGKYDGTFTRNADRSIDMTGTLVVLPGIELVTGAPPTEKTVLMPLKAHLPADMAEDQIVPVSVGDRLVQASFKRMRGL